MAKGNNKEKLDQERLLVEMYYRLLDLELKFDLFDKKIESLQRDISNVIYVRSELLKLRYDHNTDELYITEHFKIPFEGNEAVLLRHMFIKSSGRPKKSTKFYPAELAGSFVKETDGLKTATAVHSTIKRIDATVKSRTMGLEVFKIKTKVFNFL